MRQKTSCARAPLEDLLRDMAEAAGLNRDHVQPVGETTLADIKTRPDIIYTDGQSFSLWQDGELQGKVIHLEGDIDSARAKLAAPPALLALFASFFRWSPIAPRTPRQLAEMSARLCRFPLPGPGQFAYRLPRFVIRVGHGRFSSDRFFPDR